MAFNAFKESYTGAIDVVTLGKGDGAVPVGGETCFPFYLFEGQMPHKPRMALEVWDMRPDDWPEAVLAPFADVLDDPAAWAKKCVDEYGADLVVLALRSTDPNDRDADAASAVETVRKVRAAVSVPLVVWGTSSPAKDEEVLKKVAEAFPDERLILGPVEDVNHKGIGAAAMGFGHTVAACSPIDVNIAKQMNILLENLGMPTDRIIIDPTTGGLGYGLEYTYSVMERIRMAAMIQGDAKLRLPVINHLGYEIWKCKETRQGIDEAPTLGDPERRGILMESVAAVAYLMAGSDVLVLRHPESLRLSRAFAGLLLDGGDANAIHPIAKRLPEAAVDVALHAPAPDLNLDSGTAPAKTETPPSMPAIAKKDAPPPAAPAVEKPAPDEAAKAETLAREKAQTEKKIRAEGQARQAAEAEARARVEAAAREKKQNEEKARAEAQAKAEAAAREKNQAEENARADIQAREAAEAEIRRSRTEERERRASERPAATTAATPAAERKSAVDQLQDRIDWVNRRK